MRHEHLDRVTDVIGILADQTRQAVGLEELIVAFLDIAVLILLIRLDGQDDIGAEAVLLARLNRIAVRTVRLPDISLRFTARLRDDANIGCNHERCIEANAELSDDIGVIGLVFLLEGQRTALCDDAQIVFQLILRHADAVVRDGQRARIGVRGQADFIAVFRNKRCIGQRTEMALVNRVARIGDQLAQENFLVRIDRVNHHVEQALGLCLELLFSHNMSILSVIKNTRSARGLRAGVSTLDYRVLI